MAVRVGEGGWGRGEAIMGRKLECPRAGEDELSTGSKGLLESGRMSIECGGVTGAYPRQNRSHPRSSTVRPTASVSTFAVRSIEVADHRLPTVLGAFKDPGAFTTKAGFRAHA